MELNNKYASGKIYKLVDKNFTKLYIGSTTQELSQRMTDHRRQYRQWQEGSNKFTSSFEIFEEFGIENCEILLLEIYPCNNKMELRKREGEHIMKHDCVNRVVAGRCSKQYYKDNQAKIKQYYIDNKLRIEQYRNDNREILREKAKIYRLGRKEKEQERHRIYHMNNRDAKNERKRQRILCGCGVTFSRGSPKHHKQTKKHLMWLNTQSSFNDNSLPQTEP